MNPLGATSAVGLEPQLIGAIALVLSAAGIGGFVVYRLLGHSRNSLYLSLLAAWAVVGFLAWLGVPAAGIIVLALLVVFVLLGAVVAFANN